MDTFYCFADTADPWRTLALEEYLVCNLPPDTAVLYLYVHDRTVVIGKNQNAWAEVRTAALTADGGRLARRISGGGAVYHDAHNLNFSFIMSSGVYDVERQMGVITDAVRSLGIDAQVTGRNDITADGRKFSGNAFCHKRNASFHHGTILIDTDTDAMMKYLSPAPDKIASKGIASVRSRVVNLRELCPDVCPDSMTAAMKAAFAREYGEPGPLCLSDKARRDIESIAERNGTHDWLFGSLSRCDVQMHERFSWGGVTVELACDKGRIEAAKVYTDSLTTEWADELGAALIGCEFSSPAMATAVSQLYSTAETERILYDVRQMLLSHGY